MSIFLFVLALQGLFLCGLFSMECWHATKIEQRLIVLTTQITATRNTLCTLTRTQGDLWNGRYANASK